LQIEIPGGKLRNMASVLHFLEGFVRTLLAVFELLGLSPLVYVAVPAVLVTLVLCNRYRSDAGQIWRLSRWIVVGQVGLACLIYLAAVIWPASRPDAAPIKENVVGLWAIQVLGLLSIFVDVWSVWKMRGYRWLAIGSSMVHLCLLASLYFLVGMAVTGDAI
jgi:hypothetical protein